MFDAPVDAWYVWLGLAAVSAAGFGTVAELPATPPPDAGAAAHTVDRVAAVDHDATGRHPVTADAVKLSPQSVALRDDGRTTRARLSYGPVVPVARGGPLSAVVRGEPPDRHFDSPAAFDRVTDRRLNRSPRWRRGDQLYVRTVTWGDVRVTLVGA